MNEEEHNDSSIFKQGDTNSGTNSDNNTKGTSQDDFNFEKAMTDIKSIVEAIEEGKLPLDESIKKYENALTLIKKCQNLLQTANHKIEEITAADNNADDSTNNNS